jgi:hypothetical protein
MILFFFLNYILIISKKYGKLKEENLEKRLDSCKRLINTVLEQDKVTYYYY